MISMILGTLNSSVNLLEMEPGEDLYRRKVTCLRPSSLSSKCLGVGTGQCSHTVDMHIHFGALINPEVFSIC